MAERLDHLGIVADVCREIGLAEHRLRERLTATGHTIPSQVNQPTDRPTMRWVPPGSDQAIDVEQLARSNTFTPGWP